MEVAVSEQGAVREDRGEMKLLRDLMHQRAAGVFVSHKWIAWISKNGG